MYVVNFKVLGFSFKTKDELLKQEENIVGGQIDVTRVGLMSWKFHAFLSPEENHKLHRINRNCLLNAKNDSIGTVMDQLVIRNLFPEIDYEYRNGQYLINKNTDNDRKDFIIYGFGALTGIHPNKINVRIEDGFTNISERRYDFNKISNYFSWFDPFIVLNRNNELVMEFDVKSKYKIYGMTSEALGAHVVG